MLMLLGDIHGDYRVLQSAISSAIDANATALIQLGDFGMFSHNEQLFYQATQTNLPVYFIDGNHDDCSRWNKYESISKVFANSNLYYVPRGSVLELDGKTIAFMGGAGSIDKSTRLSLGIHWDEKENISPHEVRRMMNNAAKFKKIDMLLTHCPPNNVIEEHFDPRNKLYFGVGIDWKDPNQDVIENIWKQLEYPYIYSGHMHRTVIGSNYRILNIDELVEVR